MEEAELNECLDVDLQITPSTNALPINRLTMEIGETRTIPAAWILFPDLKVVPEWQSYERLGARLYRYSTVASGFTAILDIDDFGLPIDYEGIWRRVASCSGRTADHKCRTDVAS